MPTDAQLIKSLTKRVKDLEKKALDLEKALKRSNKETAAMKDCCDDVLKWIQLEIAWSNEVTAMLKMINWNKLKADYPSGGGANPPQSPPSWPPP